MNKLQLLNYLRDYFKSLEMSFDQRISKDEIKSLVAKIDDTLFYEEDQKQRSLRIKRQLKLINNNKTI